MVTRMKNISSPLTRIPPPFRSMYRYGQSKTGTKGMTLVSYQFHRLIAQPPDKFRSPRCSPFCFIGNETHPIYFTAFEKYLL
ncbi:Hypothetical protein CINCED_3A025585 [Cinara cedri]|uniref:Uncharacterized protein n=1 Tax=Cinara cedri TaxID=506608 RepID=A0A5E4M9P3_9HEMI|nr:Hypothetical protein CINCED_3A025585 [Cinara cedri]